MKIKLLMLVVILFTAFAATTAQDKDKKKKKKTDQPDLTVVEVAEKPPVIPIPEPQKPANGSLFTDQSMNGNLLVDFKAGRLGDLVFIDIVETNSANVASGAKRERDSGNLGGLSTAISAIPLPGASTVGSVLNGLGQRSYEGKGSTQRTSNVRARITARVMEVLPNGDLRVEAVKLVKINKETEQIAVTGIIRRNDLAADNSVTTLEVGDLRVEFNGKGIASADNAPGWLARIFEKINPF
jgi:flagellar L-ring protein FlgH